MAPLPRSWAACASHAVNQRAVPKRQTETQGRPPRISSLSGITPAGVPGLASRKKPVLWAFFRVFMEPVNRQTAFRNEYLARQELRHSETVSGSRLSAV